MKAAEPWDLLADQKIWSFLGDTERTISEDYLRMLFIELFSRIKQLEEQNYALQVILFETGLVNEKDFYKVKEAVKEFLEIEDNKKAREAEIFAGSGIPFVDWVNFVTKGTFNGGQD